MNVRFSLSSIVTPLYGVLTLFTACAAAWVLLYAVDFAYPTIHDVSTIGEGIDTYGPKNKFKPGFGETSPEQRYALFEKINIAVHSGGEGLANIMYESPKSNGVQKLLRVPEVVHLQDVANLIDVLRIFLVVTTLLWCGAVGFFFYTKKPLPDIPKQLIGMVVFVAVASLVILLIGAESVFNTLHVWVFPKDHQWFFYYQESLMSTLMLAPTLFAWIAVFWVVFMMLFFVGLNFGLHHIQQRWNRS